MAKLSIARKLGAGLATIALSVLAFTAAPLASAAPADADYLVGAGIYDVTGAVAETGSFGYAAGQEMNGLNGRLYAHAFIVGDLNSTKRIAMVSVDTGAIFSNIRLAVLDRLKDKYGDLYTSQNVMITATHTHVGNSGMATDQLYRIAGNDGAGFNYDQRIVDTMVNGIVAAIERAHNNLQPGHIDFQQGKLSGVAKNRSAEAYANNPDASKYDTNVREDMEQLSLSAKDGKPLGVINWFGVHPTSFSLKQTHVSADNKGYAQYLFEQKMGSDPKDPQAFVAAFANSSLGDVVAVAGNSYSSPGFEGDANDFINAEKAGGPQFEKAWELFQSGGTRLQGDLDARARYITMPGRTVAPEFTDGDGEQKLCTSARGYSFAPGAENGPSDFPGVYEGMTNDNFDVFDRNMKVDQSFVGSLVRGIGKVISLGKDPCQAEKPILIADGKLGWSPKQLPFQVLRIGEVAIIAIPFEVATMPARHLQEMTLDIMKADGVKKVILSSPANAYAGYMATRAEYAKQNYEGASTEFGPYQLAGTKQEISYLANAMLDGKQVTDEALPKIPNTKLFAQRPGVVRDDTKNGETFGQVLQEPNESYQGGETAIAKFRGAHPKNNYRTMDSFTKVQKLENGNWKDYLDDHDWDTSYHWQRDGASRSITTVEWRINPSTHPGTYRLVQNGDWKNWKGIITPYTGTSRAFEVK